jgi:hypothetical protein
VTEHEQGSTPAIPERESTLSQSELATLRAELEALRAQVAQLTTAYQRAEGDIEALRVQVVQPTSELEALHEQADQSAQLSTDAVAVIRKLTIDQNTLAQIVIRGRGPAGCRICSNSNRRQKDDPPLLACEQAYHDNGHKFLVSASTARMLLVDAFEV